MSTTRQRRKGDRVLGSWDGRYRAHPRGRWADGTIVDLSTGGVGLQVPPGAALPDVWIDVDVRAVLGRRRALVLRGAIRDAHALADGWQRVGVQFVDVPRRAQRRLARLLDRWR